MVLQLQWCIITKSQLPLLIFHSFSSSKTTCSLVSNRTTLMVLIPLYGEHICTSTKNHRRLELMKPSISSDQNILFATVRFIYALICWNKSPLSYRSRFAKKVRCICINIKRSGLPRPKIRDRLNTFRTQKEQIGSLL